jgi:glucans biosynthesis protein
MRSNVFFGLWLAGVCALPVIATAAEIPTTASDQTPPARIEFDFADVNRRAQELAAKPFDADRPELPEEFRGLDYDQYRDIRFREPRTLWRDEGLPFQTQLFHRGFIFPERVRIHVVDQGSATPLQFTSDFFDYGKNAVPPQISPELGFAGFKLLYPLHRDDKMDEVAVFLGATYFRAIGQNQNYGISARGLAIDTGLPTQEEFPLFREFWIEKPSRDATELTLYALMDSRRAAGAYRFIVRPGMQTAIEVKARVYMREPVAKFGIAPLTSMFFHGKTTERHVDDFRPEVHDSDGLIVETGGGERIWRPLVNPRGLRISQLQVTDPRGFGLLQRERDFDQYQDLEARYHTRPSAWVEPVGKWGRGAVELVEIPSGADRYDNIVAYWVPERLTAAGQEREFEYVLRLALDPEARLQGGRAVATRVGGGGTDQPDPKLRKFVIDFTGEALRRFGPDTQIEAMVGASAGKVLSPVAQYNPYTKGWRAFFELEPEGDGPVDLRCFLRVGQDVLTETWSYQWIRN